MSHNDSVKILTGGYAPRQNIDGICQKLDIVRVNSLTTHNKSVLYNCNLLILHDN